MGVTSDTSAKSIQGLEGVLPLYFVVVQRCMFVAVDVQVCLHVLLKKIGFDAKLSSRLFCLHMQSFGTPPYPHNKT